MPIRYTHQMAINDETGMAKVYGVDVDTNLPTTGVFSLNALEWIDEDIVEGIDLAWEEHLNECDEEYHDSCGPCERGTVLIGFKKGPDGKYTEDPRAEYSAIVSESTIQVTRSKWIVSGEWCSPCYPGQVDAETEGPWIGFSVPPDVVGSGSYGTGQEFLKARIKPLSAT